MLKFDAILRQNGIMYLKAHTGSGYWRRASEYYYDGQKAASTFHKDWVMVPRCPQKVERSRGESSDNYRYVLQDLDLKSDKLKAVFPRDEVTKLDEDGDRVWIKSMRQYESLYKLEWDTLPPSFENIPFEITLVYEFTDDEDLIDPSNFKYPAPSISYYGAPKGRIVRYSSVTHNFVDAVVMPDVMLPMRPSTLSSQDMFDVVRQHIRDNINPKAARIKSDYDFCFSVERRVHLHEPYVYTVDANALRRTKRKKMVKKTQTERGVECFNMAPKPYQKYKVIKPLQGDNTQHLKELLDEYLDGLMEFINQTGHECKTCKGMGITYQPLDN